MLPPQGNLNDPSQILTKYPRIELPIRTENKTALRRINLESTANRSNVRNRQGRNHKGVSNFKSGLRVRRRRCR